MLAAIVMCAAATLSAFENPPVKNCASQAEAFNLAMAVAAQEHAELIPTTGTGSMKPLIPGKAVLLVKKDFAAVAVGSVLVYLGRVKPGGEEMSLCHRAKAYDRQARGFIMQGDHGCAPETWQRVTPKNYRGTVLMIFNYPAEAWPATNARPREPEPARLEQKREA